MNYFSIHSILAVLMVIGSISGEAFAQQSSNPQATPGRAQAVQAIAAIQAQQGGSAPAASPQAPPAQAQPAVSNAQRNANTTQFMMSSKAAVISPSTQTQATQPSNQRPGTVLAQSNGRGVPQNNPELEIDTLARDILSNPSIVPVVTHPYGGTTTVKTSTDSQGRSWTVTSIVTRTNGRRAETVRVVIVDSANRERIEYGVVIASASVNTTGWNYRVTRI